MPRFGAFERARVELEPWEMATIAACASLYAIGLRKLWHEAGGARGIGKVRARPSPPAWRHSSLRSLHRSTRSAHNSFPRTWRSTSC
jgi:hypothetical protein